MKRFILRTLFFIPCTTFQTYTMENKLVQHPLVNTIKSTLITEQQHNYEAISQSQNESISLKNVVQQNPDLVKPTIIQTMRHEVSECIADAKKEPKTQLNKTKQDDVYINLDLQGKNPRKKNGDLNVIKDDKDTKPLLIDAIQQKNIAIIDLLSKEGTDIVNEDSEYYKTRKRQLLYKAISIGLITITAIGISSGIGYWIWAKYPFNCTLVEDFLGCDGYNFNIKCDPYSCNLPCTITCGPCNPFSDPICTGPTQTLPCKAQVGNDALLCNGIFTPMCKLISYCYNHS